MLGLARLVSLSARSSRPSSQASWTRSTSPCCVASTPNPASAIALDSGDPRPSIASAPSSQRLPSLWYPRLHQNRPQGAPQAERQFRFSLLECPGEGGPHVVVLGFEALRATRVDPGPVSSGSASSASARKYSACSLLISSASPLSSSFSLAYSWMVSSITKRGSPPGPSSCLRRLLSERGTHTVQGV